MEIKFNNVDFSYKKVNYIEKTILKNINIQFIKGKINGIIGKSGSGKTTLVELINNLLSPTSGTISIDKYIIGSNKRLNNLSELRFNVGLVFQYPEEEIFNITVKDELELTLKLFNYKLEQINKRIEDALKMVGLSSDYLEMNPTNLSRGELRLVAIANSLLLNPKVLILDEPTIGLDDKSKKELIKLIRMLKNRYNKTIIVISQDIDFLHKFVDYVYVLNNKEIVLSGSKYEVFKNSKKLKECGLKVPKIIEFEEKVLSKKKIKIGYRDDINDLIKDIYRYVK